MRRIFPRKPSFRIVPAWTVALMLAAAGAGVSVAAAGDKKPVNLAKEPVPKADETVGDIAFVRSNDSTKIEGVGLVIGLSNTGSNPPPSADRTKLLNIMRKATVPDAERWLEDPSTSLVLVRATIPAGVSTDDRFDVEVILPPGSSTTSLKGGNLLLTELRIRQFAGGEIKEGQPMGEAGGPVMIGSSAAPDEPRIGRILGGARVFKDNFYALILKEDRRGFRTADLLQRVINMRFHERKGIDQVGMAVAQQPDFLMLNVPRVYHHNQYRYFQIVERLPMMDSPALQAQHLETWTKELLDPRTAGAAALKLEGIGRNATEAIKVGLTSPNEQVRFFAAESLAYLNDSAGVDELAEAATNRPMFRAEALAALAALDSSASYLRLRKLMDEPDPELRYGAFNALRTVYAEDPFLGRVSLARNRRSPVDGEDEQALRLRSAPSRREERPQEPFELYLVECDGPPLVHISRSRRREIVVFSRGQQLLTPIAIGGGGPFLLNAALNDNQVQISRFALSRFDMADAKVTSSLDMGSILAEVANLGATYPEVVALLQVADRQKNLSGPLVIDALPSSRSDYDAAQLAGIDATAPADAAVGQAGFEPDDGEKTKVSFFKRFTLGDRLKKRFGR